MSTTGRVPASLAVKDATQGTQFSLIPPGTQRKGWGQSREGGVTAVRGGNSSRRQIPATLETTPRAA